jgi:hypothetical protein
VGRDGAGLRRYNQLLVAHDVVQPARGARTGRRLAWLRPPPSWCLSAQVWQWVRHNVTTAEGQVLSAQLVTRWLDQECEAFKDQVGELAVCVGGGRGGFDTGRCRGGGGAGAGRTGRVGAGGSVYGAADGS